MGAKVEAHILPESFYKDMKAFFGAQGQASINYFKCKNEIDKALRHTQTVINGEAKPISNAPISQDFLEEAHDVLLKLMDARLYAMCHLLKINNFMPNVVNRFGPTFRYEDRVEEGVKFPEKGQWRDGVYCHYDFVQAADARQEPYQEHLAYCELNLERYCDPKVLDNDIGTQLSEGYTYLNTLRRYMSPQTLRKREDNIQRDAFSREFLYGRETEASSAADRMEYTYFMRMGVNLGIFQTSPKVAKWLAAARKDSAYCKRVIDCLKEGNRGLMLPAVTLKENRNQGFDNHLARQFARDLKGPIPKEGILLGDVQNQPARGIRPTLVAQPTR